MLPRIFALLIVSLIGPNVHAQLKWEDVSELFEPLPKSVKVFRSTDTLNGRPFIGYYVEADLKDKKLDFTTDTSSKRRLTPTQFFDSKNKPLIVVNGTFFSFQTNQNLNLVIKDGRLISYTSPSAKSKLKDSFYYPTKGAIGISTRRRADVAWTFTDTSQPYAYAFQSAPVLAQGKTEDPSIKDLNTLDHWKRWKMNTAIGGGPVVVHNSMVQVTNIEEQMFVKGEKDRHPRTAMGYTKNRKLIILAIQGRFPGVAEGATLAEEGKILLDIGCVEGLNLDGGGSSCLLVNGKETIKPSDKEGQRAVPAVFIIRQKS